MVYALWPVNRGFAQDFSVFVQNNSAHILVSSERRVRVFNESCEKHGLANSLDMFSISGRIPLLTSMLLLS